MKTLTALLTALLALAMVTGPSIAAEMTGGEKSSVSIESELWKKLSPHTFGTGYITDGVSYEEFRGTSDKHYGVAPAWEGRPEEPLTMVEKREKELWRLLGPNTVGTADIADGVSYEEFRGTSDKHYGVAPAWEGRPEEPLTMVEKREKELWRQLGPNVTYDTDVK